MRGFTFFLPPESCYPCSPLKNAGPRPFFSPLCFVLQQFSPPPLAGCSSLAAFRFEVVTHPSLGRFLLSGFFGGEEFLDLFQRSRYLTNPTTFLVLDFDGLDGKGHLISLFLFDSFLVLSLGIASFDLRSHGFLLAFFLALISFPFL